MKAIAINRLTVYLLVLTLVLSLFALPVFASPPDNNPGGGQTQTPPGQERIDVLIGFYGKPNRSLVESSDGEITHEFTLVKVISARLPQQAIDALSKNPHIRFIEPELEMMSLSQSTPWGISRVFGSAAYPFPSWQLTKQHNVSIAVLDTGIDNSHPDLTSVRGGVNTIDSTHWGSDVYGHGTHVAGTIAAADNSIGVVGVAPGFDIYAVKVLNDSGLGNTTSVARGIEWAVNNNIKIVSMSLGSSGNAITLEEACDAAYQAGVLLVAAAGNESGSNVYYPARYISVIAVSASDSNNKLAGFSNVGPTVELIAPGVNIRSTTPGNTYSTWSGTSMATPHVAGVAAHAWSLNSSLTNAQIRGILRSTAQNLDLPAEHQGYGLVRADLAAAAAAPAQDPLPEQVTPQTYSLSMAVSGEGTVTPQAGSHEYETGSVVDIQAYPAQGWQFKEWQGPVTDPASTATTVVVNEELKVTAIFEPVGPPAPLLRAPASSAVVIGTTITFSWYQSPGANRYEIQLLRADDNSIYRTVTLKNVTSYRMSSLPNNGTEFIWQVRAGNSAVWGEWSVPRSLKNNDVPVAPTLRSPADNALLVGTTLTFSWNKTNNASSYRIRVFDPSGAVFREVDLKNVTAYKMSGFPNDGTWYTWQVQAANAVGSGDWSAPRTFQNNVEPATPTLRSPAAGARVRGTTITFQWNSAARASGYELEIRNADTGAVVNTISVTTTSHRLGGFLNDGTAYIWRVRARNPVGYSDWSQERSFNNF
jgi:hypothetical protein